MRISNRELAIISFTARFGQVTSEHIRRTVFADNKSTTPCKRALARLISQKLLARIEIRTVGGARGGSGQYVYQIGPAGWKLADTEGAYWLARSVKYHSLAIADVFLSIHEAQGEHMSVVRYETEPDSHVKINYVPLLPDLYVELLMNGSTHRRAWLEIDLGTERPKQLKDKLNRYHMAWSGAGEKWNPFPFVVWVVPDDKRKAELLSLIAQEPKESQPMYRVTTFERVAEVVAG